MYQRLEIDEGHGFRAPRPNTVGATPNVNLKLNSLLFNHKGFNCAAATLKEPFLLGFPRVCGPLQLPGVLIDTNWTLKPDREISHYARIRG